MDKYHETLFKLKKDFKLLKSLNEEDFEFRNIVKEWTNFIELHFDVNGLVADNKPYSLNSSKYYIYSDEILMSDPYGYYSQERVVFGKDKPANSMFASDLPMGDDFWALYELEKALAVKNDLVKRKDM